MGRAMDPAGAWTGGISPGTLIAPEALVAGHLSTDTPLCPHCRSDAQGQLAVFASAGLCP